MSYVVNMIYKRGEWTMEEQNEEKKKKFFNEHPFIMSVLSSLVASGLIALFGWLIVIKSLPSRMNSLENKVDGKYLQLESQIAVECAKEVNEKISQIDTKIAEECRKNFDNYKNELQNLANNDSQPSIVYNNYNYINGSDSNVTASLESMREGIPNSKISLFDDSTILGYDINNNPYYAKDLINQNILVPYMEENQEIYFYGKFNENYHWNGDCLINVYKNNNLILITEAIYDDGKLLSYKQVLPFVATDNINVWSISERIAKDDFNVGDSWNYIRNEEYAKDFDFDTVTDEDILDVYTFKSRLDTKLEGYYHGNTSDGNYNDDTGNAYMIKYNLDEGFIRGLYVGIFKDGQLNDNEESSWEIIFDDTDNSYFYYKGNFENGDREDDSKIVSHLTQGDINNYIKDIGFGFDLNWYSE